ncbi:MAG: thermonuclease family protein [Pseudonocardia sp.]|nr:thermonuclease family protein [Pseudonocardia sp.]
MRAFHLLIGTLTVLAIGSCATGEATPPAAGPQSETVTVASVADGDTFTLTDGRRVRVLGIDSCESGTAAGPAATDDATALIEGRIVTLRPEPGVHLDPYGRVLRYVTVPDGRDLGTIMVARPHTAVYEGGDAAESYVETLRALDNGPRTCAGTATIPAPASPQPAVVGSDCHPSYVPCVPNGPDLDCSDIGHPVRVIGPDSFRLDVNDDGSGCE